MASQSSWTAAAPAAILYISTLGLTPTFMKLWYSAKASATAPAGAPPPPSSAPPLGSTSPAACAAAAAESSDSQIS